MIKRSIITLTFSAAMVLGLGAAAGAQDTCSGSPQVCVQSNQPTTNAPTSPAPVAAPAPTAQQPTQTLPVTGSETAVLALGGLVLVSAGGALVWRSNKAAA